MGQPVQIAHPSPPLFPFFFNILPLPIFLPRTHNSAPLISIGFIYASLVFSARSGKMAVSRKKRSVSPPPLNPRSYLLVNIHRRFTTRKIRLSIDALSWKSRGNSPIYLDPQVISFYIFKCNRRARTILNG